MVTIDIDGGMKLPGSGARSVDAVIAIFGQGGKKLRENDDAGYPLDRVPRIRTTRASPISDSLQVEHIR